MDAFWEIPLDHPPKVVMIGRHAHGFNPVDRFRLPDLWTVHLYGYNAELKIDNLQLPIRPGFAGVIPPGKSIEYRYQGISVHLFAHFRLPEGGKTLRRIPAMQDLGERYDLTYRRLFDVIGSFAEERDRVEARVWDLLWDLTSASSQPRSDHNVHLAVRKAVDIIARNLNEPIVVEDLANTVGVSYSYLARLFQEAFGTTVVGYIRAKRLERALHLLERSTLPIKAIASSTGISDLHHFNKSVRTQYGLSPRRIRERFEQTGVSISPNQELPERAPMSRLSARPDDNTV